MQRFVYASHQLDEVRRFFRQITEAIAREERAVPGEIDATPLPPALRESLDSGELLALELPLPQPAIGATSDAEHALLHAEAPDALQPDPPTPLPEAGTQAPCRAELEAAAGSEREGVAPDDPVSACAPGSEASDAWRPREYDRSVGCDGPRDEGATRYPGDAATHGAIAVADSEAMETPEAGLTADYGMSPLAAADIDAGGEASMAQPPGTAAPEPEVGDAFGLAGDPEAVTMAEAGAGADEFVAATTVAGGSAGVRAVLDEHTDAHSGSEAASTWIAGGVTERDVEPGASPIGGRPGPVPDEQTGDGGQMSSWVEPNDDAGAARADSASPYAPAGSVVLAAGAASAAAARSHVIGDDAVDRGAAADGPGSAGGVVPGAVCAVGAAVEPADGSEREADRVGTAGELQVSPGPAADAALVDVVPGVAQTLPDSLRNLLVDEVRQMLAAVYASQLQAERQRREAVEATVQKLQEQRDNLELELRDARESLVVLKAEMTRIDERSRALEADSRNQQSELRSLRESRRLLDAQLQELRDAAAAERTRAEVAERRCEMLEISVTSSESDSLVLQRDIDSLRIDLGRALEDRRAVADALSEREAELATLREEHAALSARMETLSAQHAELSREAEVLRQREAERSAAIVRESAAHAPTSAAPPTPRIHAASRGGAAFLDEIDSRHALRDARSAGQATASRPDPEREKSRLRVLATPFEEAAVGEYLAAVPWSGFPSVTAMSIGTAEGAAAEDRSIGAFAVAAATANAIGRSGGGASQSNP